MDWNSLLNQRIFVKLNSGEVYNGFVIEVESEGNVTFITINDKYGSDVVFPISQIVKLVREGE